MMSIRFCIVIACLLAFVSPSFVFAQSKREVLSLCQEALASGDNEAATELANVVKTWTTLFSDELEVKGAECISAATGEAWRYSRGTLSFVSESELEAARQERMSEINARDAALNARRCELLEDLLPILVRRDTLQKALENSERETQVGIRQAQAETVQTCHAWYADDAMAALTNPVCNALFLQVGLQPSATVTTSLVQIELQSLVDEINVITSSIAIIDDWRKLPEEVVAEEEERLKGVLIANLPNELQGRAQSMSSSEIEIMAFEYEISQCN